MPMTEEQKAEFERLARRSFAMNKAVRMTLGEIAEMILENQDLKKENERLTKQSAPL